jgi:hypothetical protein
MWKRCFLCNLHGAVIDGSDPVDAVHREPGRREYLP